MTSNQPPQIFKLKCSTSNKPEPWLLARFPLTQPRFDNTSQGSSSWRIDEYNVSASHGSSADPRTSDHIMQLRCHDAASSTQQNGWDATQERGQRANYYFFVKEGEDFHAVPCEAWYNFKPSLDAVNNNSNNTNVLSAEEVDALVNRTRVPGARAHPHLAQQMKTQAGETPGSVLSVDPAKGTLAKDRDDKTNPEDIIDVKDAADDELRKKLDKSWTNRRSKGNLSKDDLLQEERERHQQQQRG